MWFSKQWARCLWLVMCMCLAGSHVRAQYQPTTFEALTQVTLAEYELDGLSPAMPYGYHLLPMYAHSPEGQALADRIWRGRIRLYSDSACTERLRKGQVRRRYPFLYSYRPKPFANLPTEAQYALAGDWHLQQNERWALTDSGLQRSVQWRRLQLERFVQTEEGSSRQVQFEAYIEVSGEVPFPSRLLWHDLFAVSDYSPTELMADGRMGTKALRISPTPDSTALVALTAAFAEDAEAKRWAQTALRESHKTFIWFSIPLQALPSNYWTRLGLPDPNRMQQNQRFFTQAVPKLLRDQLTGRIPSYISSLALDEPMPEAEIQSVVARHSSTLLSPTATNAGRIDFSYGVQEVAVGGSLARNRSNQVYFKPQYISLLWLDEELGGLRQLGLLKLSDINTRQYAVDGQPLDLFLAQQLYYSYLIQVGYVYPRSLAQAALIAKMLRTGAWEELPTLQTLSTYTDGELEDWLKR